MKIFQCNLALTTTYDNSTHNSTYKKLTVQWLNEVLCFVSSFVVADVLCFQVSNFLYLQPVGGQAWRRHKIEYDKRISIQLH